MNLSSRVGVDRLGRYGGNNNGSVSSASPGERTPSRAGEWLPNGVGFGSSGGSGGGASNTCVGTGFGGGCIWSDEVVSWSLVSVKPSKSTLS